MVTHPQESLELVLTRGLTTKLRDNYTFKPRKQILLNGLMERIYTHVVVYGKLIWAYNIYPGNKKVKLCSNELKVV